MNEYRSGTEPLCVRSELLRPAAASERVKQRLLDSLACALGSYGSAPVMNASRFACSVPVENSTIFGGQPAHLPWLEWRIDELRICMSK
jgi:2-methylcitrate dehydratase PrpD